MSHIIPFKAVRPSKDKVQLVVSRSYEDYRKKELKATLTYNPFSFLHIINPGFKFHREIAGPERFLLVKNRFDEFREEDIFIKDTQPCFYLYQMRTRNHEFCGFFCAASVADYRNDVIRKHESTIKAREILFKDYLKTVGFNAEPVLLTYPDHEGIENIMNDTRKKQPEYHFTTTDKINHQMWVINDKTKIEAIQAYVRDLSVVYIADGHHRSASSSLLSEEMKELDPENEKYHYFMSYMIPESSLRIFEFNRMVKDLNGLSVEDFLIRLDKVFRIEFRGQEPYKPEQPHHFSMYLDGSFYSLYLRKNYNFSDPLSELDTQILYTEVLKPVLGIKNLRKNNRIAYGYGKDNLIRMKEQVDNKKFAVGFNLYPVSVEQLKRIADAGQVMPPKSTYIQPKLRSGLTIYEF
ncbi:DUF1015 domain-containing protein [Robertkochia aurantiaca]|uniref:DUF1015 domain-containing protein n=1 Tax=Robertkochia aurantiaca TaxID=2873700 RepID=UPI001CC9B0D0|nr:DUF1015 domain-containing protein [Robertkochia sp. 3YJGBD-33]